MTHGFVKDRHILRHRHRSFEVDLLHIGACGIETVPLIQD